jgi:hypothetical protein
MAEGPSGKPPKPAEAAAATRDVFISHASPDATVAIAIVEALERN